MVSEALLPVQARFRDLALQRAMALKALRADLENGRNPQEALAGIADLAHKIAGVAETVGFPEAGHLAAALDRAAGNGLEDQTPMPELWASLEPQLAALIDELELILEP